MNSLNQCLRDALEALKNYDAGSSRASLMLIDVAVADGSKALHSRETRELEQSLVNSLREAKYAAGQEYAASKLRLIGSDLSVSVLADLLSDPRLSGPARNALEGIPHPAAGKALILALTALHGLQQVGAIHSLGARREKAAVKPLEKLLNSEDTPTAAAAAFALGEIGTTDAAKALAARLSTSPEPLHPVLFDATLACAELLQREGHSRQASALREALKSQNTPKHVKEALSRTAAT